jgi:deoxyribose-phosphate aldolase
MIIKNFLQFLKENQSQPDYTKLNKKIEITFLDQDININKIKEKCDLIKNSNNSKYVYGIVIKPDFIHEVKKHLENTDLKIITVISFPNGDEKNYNKIKNIEKYITDGADEFNVVIDYKKLLESNDLEEKKEKDVINAIQKDIRSMVEICKEKSKNIKVIIEMEALNDIMNIIKAVDICKNANVDFITTSTGVYNQNTDYTFDKKLNDVIETIIPRIQGMDDLNINISGGINSSDKILQCLKHDKIQRISTSILPDNLLNTASPIYQPKPQDELISQ